MQMSLWSIIVQTDFATKMILLLLLAMSVLCWSILFYKAIIFKSKLKQLAQAQQLLQKITTFDDLINKSSLLRDSFAGILIAKYLSEFKNIIKSQDGLRVLSVREWEVLQTNISGLMEDTLAQEETGIPALSTCAAVSPLIGLFGTVWGLIHAFMSISLQKSADIAAVAPGIAEALITTLIGLCVAIPALVMFNFLRVQARSVEHSVLLLTEKCMSIMKLATCDMAMFPQGNTIKTVAVN